MLIDKSLVGGGKVATVRYPVLLEGPPMDVYECFLAAAYQHKVQSIH
jgi:hypothetical protein